MEQESMEARLAHFRGKLEALKFSRVNDATLQSVADVGKLGRDEMSFWERYVALIKSAGDLSGEQLVGTKEKLDTLVSDIKYAISNTKDGDLENFFAWMNNRMMGLRGIIDYLDDVSIRKDLLNELEAEKNALGL